MILACASSFAGEKVLTTPDRVNLWAKDLTKELKKVKFKDAYVTFSDFTDRAFDAIDAGGLQTGGTVFPSLAADLQSALTRLKTDLQTLRDKRAAVKKTIDDLARDLRTAANSTTPPSLDVSARLILSCYTAVSDGDVLEKERDGINDLAAIVVATSGLAAQSIADINTHVAAVNASRGINKTDLMMIADDLKAILDMTK
jgi:hypothetical protein